MSKPRDFLPHYYALAYAYLAQLGKRRKYRFLRGRVTAGPRLDRATNELFVEVYVDLLGVRVGLPAKYMSCGADAFDKGDRVLIYADNCDYTKMVIVGSAGGAPPRCGFLQMVVWGQPELAAVHGFGPKVPVTPGVFTGFGPDFLVDFKLVEAADADARTTNPVRLFRFSLRSDTLVEVYRSDEVLLAHFRMYGQSGVGKSIDVRGPGSHGPRDAFVDRAGYAAGDPCLATILPIYTTPQPFAAVPSKPYTSWKAESKALWTTYYAANSPPSSPTLNRVDLTINTELDEPQKPVKRFTFEVPSHTVSGAVNVFISGAPLFFEGLPLQNKRTMVGYRGGGAFTTKDGDYFVMEKVRMVATHKDFLSVAIFAGFAEGLPIFLPGATLQRFDIRHTRELILIHGPSGKVQTLSATGEADGTTGVVGIPASYEALMRCSVLGAPEDDPAFLGNGRSYLAVGLPPTLPAGTFQTEFYMQLGVTGTPESSSPLKPAGALASTSPPFKASTAWMCNETNANSPPGILRTTAYGNKDARPVASDTELFIIKLRIEPAGGGGVDLIALLVTSDNAPVERLLMASTPDAGGTAAVLDVTPDGKRLLFAARGVFRPKGGQRLRFAGIYEVDSTTMTGFKFVQSGGLRYTTFGAADGLATGEEIPNTFPVTAEATPAGALTKDDTWSFAVASDARTWVDAVTSRITTMDTSAKLVRFQKKTALQRLRAADDNTAFADDAPDARYFPGTFVLREGNAGDGTFGGHPAVAAYEGAIDIVSVTVPATAVTGHFIQIGVTVRNTGVAPVLVTEVSSTWLDRKNGGDAAFTDFVASGAGALDAPLAEDEEASVALRFFLREGMRGGIFSPQPKAVGTDTGRDLEITGLGVLTGGVTTVLIDTVVVADPVELELSHDDSGNELPITKPAALPPNTTGEVTAQVIEAVLPYIMLIPDGSRFEDVYDTLILVTVGLRFIHNEFFVDVDRTADFDVTRTQTYTISLQAEFAFGQPQEVRLSYAADRLVDDRPTPLALLRQVYASFNVSARASATPGTYFVVSEITYYHASDPDRNVHTATVPTGAALVVQSPARLTVTAGPTTLLNDPGGTLRRQHGAKVTFTLHNTGQGAAVVATVALIFTRANGDDSTEDFTPTTSTGPADILGGASGDYEKGFSPTKLAHTGTHNVTLHVVYVDEASGSSYTIETPADPVIVANPAHVVAGGLSRGFLVAPVLDGSPANALVATLTNLAAVDTSPGSVTALRCRVYHDATHADVTVCFTTDAAVTPSLPLAVAANESGAVVNLTFSVSAGTPDAPVPLPPALLNSSFLMYLEVRQDDSDTGAHEVVGPPNGAVLSFVIADSEVRITAETRLTPTGPVRVEEPVNIELTQEQDVALDPAQNYYWHASYPVTVAGVTVNVPLLATSPALTGFDFAVLNADPYRVAFTPKYRLPAAAYGQTITIAPYRVEYKRASTAVTRLATIKQAVLDSPVTVVVHRANLRVVHWALDGIDDLRDIRRGTSIGATLTLYNEDELAATPTAKDLAFTLEVMLGLDSPTPTDMSAFLSVTLASPLSDMPALATQGYRVRLNVLGTFPQTGMAQVLVVYPKVEYTPAYGGVDPRRTASLEAQALSPGVRLWVLP